MEINGNVIRASDGKVFRRKGTDEIFSDEIVLGYSYYIGGVKQDPPHKDVPEDFEEIEFVEEVSENDEEIAEKTR